MTGFVAAFVLMGYYQSWKEERVETTLPETDMRPVSNVSSGAPIPELAIETTVDTVDGYNVTVALTNFTLSPGLLGQPATPNTGYIGVYINDQKVSRLYGEWLHIGLDDLSSGQNTLELVLMANDHTEWAQDGQTISETVVLTDL